MNTNIIGKANDIVNKTKIAYIATIDENGYPSVSTISSIKTDGIYHAYFATGLASGKAKKINKCTKTSLCYRDEGNNITLIGESQLLTDQKIKTSLWEDWFINHFPEGAEDPNYCILKFTTKKCILWIDNESAEADIAEILKPKSRCGCYCKPDVCREKYNCSCIGCFNTHPFWGECPVKICCESKGFTHCGECDELPCDLIYEFSCGDGDECDRPKGSRIDLIRKQSGRSFYKCGIIKESLDDKSIISKYKNYEFTSYSYETNDTQYPIWHIHGYIFSHNLLLKVIDELKEHINPDWYIHAFNEENDTLYVVLKKCIFKLPCKRNESWEEMIKYGESIGLERKWTENIPMKV